jgi:YD repeat-containing protein
MTTPVLANVDGLSWEEAGGWMMGEAGAASRLITVTDGVNDYGFRYDGDGNRLARIVNGTLTTHTLDVGLALPEVIVAYESAGTLWYLHLP